MAQSKNVGGETPVVALVEDAAPEALTPVESDTEPTPEENVLVRVTGFLVTELIISDLDLVITREGTEIPENLFPQVQEIAQRSGVQIVKDGK